MNYLAKPLCPNCGKSIETGEHLIRDAQSHYWACGVQEPKVGTTYWLIERDTPAVWLQTLPRDGDDEAWWTCKSTDAMRFASREEAQELIYRLPDVLRYAQPTEHIDCPGPKSDDRRAAMRELVERALRMMEAAGYNVAPHDGDHNNPIIAWMADARELLVLEPKT
jgi:hypothetical protein